MDNAGQRVRYFRMVRDIPYRVPLSVEDQGYECVVKPEILEKLLQTLGLESRHIIAKFQWEDLGLPEKVVKHDHEDPETHEFLEVKIPETGEWVAVDPTWDSRISHEGLPTLEWDGKTGTGVGVETLEVLNPRESREFIEQDSVGEVRKDYFDRYREFFRALNRYLRSTRK